jgi:mannosylglycerate hydrolase
MPPSRIVSRPRFAPPVDSPPFELHVVAHTHWDREWYHTAERFRVRLVALVDELLDDPPAPGESFLLDGQAIVLEDFLAVRPERAAELSALLREGRLEAGPWYVLADELIPSGEALVRNLLAGRELVSRLRGEPPPVLYCPDSFGHPAILPDLARGFGCNVVILWRGYGGKRWPAGDTARWRSPSGAEVLLYHLPPDGYEFGSSLPTSPEAVGERWQRIRSALAPRAVTGVALLLNGADHHARQLGQREAVALLAAAALPARVVPSTLRGASAAIVSASAEADLPVVKGELRDSYGYTWTLQGTLATRAAQKRRNAMLESQLVRDVEPWIALARAGGAGATRALLHAAWRELLRCHPHDTLCGTSIDAVAAACDARQAAVETMSATLREGALLRLVGHDEEGARQDASRWRPALVLRNRAPRPRRGVAELVLRATVADVAVGPGSGTRQGARRQVGPWEVDEMPLQLLSCHERVALTESPRAYPDADVISEAHAVGWVDAIDGYATLTLPHRAGREATIPNPVTVQGHTLDNGIVRVEVSDAGVVRFEDRRSGRTVEDLLSLEAHVDLGDLYTPSIRESLPTPAVRKVRVLHRGPLRGEIAVDYTLLDARGHDRGDCRVSVQLDADLAAVRIAVAGDSGQRDHRLRLRVATGLAGAPTLADAAFHPVLRRAVAIEADDARMERALPTAPLHRWVSRLTTERGVTLFSDGLAEYQSDEDGVVAVTLVRGVGALSRHDLAERPGHAGWPADTPEAQSLGPFEARFALAMHGGEGAATRDEIERLADDLLLPIVGETLRSSLDGPRVAGGLALEGDGLAFSAAKPAQRGGWIALRCVNRRDETVRGQWRLSRPVEEAQRARLDETGGAPLEVLGEDRTVVAFEAAPYEIVTILVR